MLRFILSCVLLISIVLWWAEARFNYLYAIVDAMKKCCDWVKNQTKFKIDVCKWFLPILLIVGAIVYLYYPYFKDTLDFKDGAVVIRDYPKESQEKELVSNQVTKNLDSEEKTNPIGDWGTFGDFIGGTLNPIIGFISILLLFATWKLTRKTLDFTREELKNSNQLLLSQQFDSLFFNLLESFQTINKEYMEDVKKENFYQKLFLSKESNLALSKNILLIQYFASLSILLKTINSKLEFIQDKKQSDELKSFYVDIVLSKISFDIQQIIAWYAFLDDDLKITLENSGFFKKIDFQYYVDSKSKIFENYNFELLSNLHRYDEKIFHNSKNITDLKKLISMIFFFQMVLIYINIFKINIRMKYS